MKIPQEVIENFIDDCISAGKFVVSTKILLPAKHINDIERILIKHSDMVARRELRTIIDLHAKEYEKPLEQLVKQSNDRPILFISGKTSYHLQYKAVKRHLENGGSILFMDTESPSKVVIEPATDNNFGKTPVTFLIKYNNPDSKYDGEIYGVKESSCYPYHYLRIDKNRICDGRLCKKYCMKLNGSMTGKFKKGDMVYLYNDIRELMDRRNEARIDTVCESFYLVQKMSNGSVHSYYEQDLILKEKA